MSIQPAKKYRCKKCNKEINRHYRLVLMEWGKSRLGDFKTIEHYDLCDKHYEIFRDWIKRNKIKN